MVATEERCPYKGGLSFHAHSIMLRYMCVYLLWCTQSRVSGMSTKSFQMFLLSDSFDVIFEFLLAFPFGQFDPDVRFSFVLMLQQLLL